METILKTVDLVKYYGDGESEVRAIDHTSIEVENGEFVAIVGRSGSGKSTLLHMLGGLDRPDSGEVMIGGKNIFSLKDEQLAVFRRRKIGFIFQDFNLIPALNVWENIILPLSLHGMTGRESESSLKRLAWHFGIEDELDKFPSQMSGGQKQRVAAARALIGNPGIVLADEPTGALDSRNSKVLMDRLSALNEDEGRTIVMVTHDANAASYCSRILFIQDGRLFHELRRNVRTETTERFYERIVTVLSQLGGGSANVL